MLDQSTAARAYGVAVAVDALVGAGDVANARSLARQLVELLDEARGDVAEVVTLSRRR